MFVNPGSRSLRGRLIKNKPAAITTFRQQGMINGTIVETHSSNNAYFSLKTLSGNDPSNYDPVIFNFTDGSHIIQTTPLTLQIASGATMGAFANNNAFRLWLVVLNNSGTAVLAAGILGGFGNPSIISLSFNFGNSTNVTSPPGNTLATLYANVTVSNKPCMFVAYATYESGLSTIGNWNVSPSFIGLVGPGGPTPGQILRTVSVTGTQTQTTSTSYVISSLAVSVTPLSAANGLLVQASFDCYGTGDGIHTTLVACRLYRDSTYLGVTQTNYLGGSIQGMCLEYFDFPTTTNASVYAMFLVSGDGHTVGAPWAVGTITVKEYMS
jgi:hypothetical protein